MISLVIDIRSDVVEGTLTDSKDILYSTSVHLSQNPHSGEELTKLMLKSVEDLCAHISEESRKYTREQIGSAHYILSSPWVISQSKTVTVQYDTDTEITEAIIKSVVEENHQALVKTYESDMVFIEQKIFAVELNGYPVQEYRGKKARTLRISCAFSLSSDKIIKDIKIATSRTLHIRKEYYHSAILLHYLSYRSRMTDDKEYILIHIHGELTDMVIVKKGMSAYLGSFPFGTSTLVRKLSHSLKNNLETTRSALSLYEEGKLEESQNKKIKDLLSLTLKSWQEKCLQSFHSIGEKVALPKIVYLSSDSSNLSSFRTVLEESGFEVVLDDTPLLKLYVSALDGMI